MKRLAFIAFIALLAGLTGLFAQQERFPSSAAQASQSQVPYKATTVDECVHERKCALYAFTKALERPGISALTDPVVKKWNGPIKVLIFGDQADALKAKVEVVFKKLDPYFPYPIQILSESESDKANYVIVSSQDFYKDLTVTHKSFFEKFAFGEVAQAYKNKPHFGQSFHESFPGSDKNGFYVVCATFLKPGYENQLGEIFLRNISFTQPLFMPELTDYKSDQLNNLHFLLLKILYHPDIKTKFTALEAGNVFNRLFPTILTEIFEEDGTNEG